MEYNINDETDSSKKVCYNMLDLWLVLLHTTLYFVNFYGFAMTAGSYTKSINIDEGISGILQAATPIAALLGGFLFNYITRHNTYLWQYYFALSLLITGNLLYYLAETAKASTIGAVILLLLGRMLFGIGGSRLMTRKFLAINVQVWAQSKYSAIFVMVSSLGQTCGPGLSSILIYVPPRWIGPTYLAEFNILAFVFIFIWTFIFLIFVIFFKGSDKKESAKNLEDIEKEELLYNQENYFLEENELRNISKHSKKLDSYKNQSFKISALPRIHENKITTSKTNSFSKKFVPFFKAYFPNSITVFSLFCFMIIKMIQEAFFTELPKIAKHYYNQSNQYVGWYFLLSTIYAVPFSILPNFLSKKWPDRYILLLGFGVFLIGSIIKINFTFREKQNEVQFYVGSSILFAGTLIAEGAAIAILVKVISPTLKRSFLNAGLLSGSGDTFARAIGNASYTLFVFFAGLSGYSFAWYITASGLIAIFLIVSILILNLLQKYTILKILDDRNIENEKIEQIVE